MPASAGKKPCRSGCHAKPTEGENPGRQVPQVGARGSRSSPNRSGSRESAARESAAGGTGNICPPSDKANVPGASPKFTLPPQSAAGEK